MNKYRAVNKPILDDRSWPSRSIEKAPIWCNVDLRDGNQALANPMNPESKLQWFRTITAIGFKEIEVSFPSASQQDYDFTRLLIENQYIPNDVTIQVLTQAREHLIRRTFDALSGVKRAIFHIYNSTSPAQRQMVFGKTEKEIIVIAIDGIKLVRELAEKSGSEIILEYSPESFSQTELPFAAEICHAVVDTWAPKDHEQVIINLPSTVEVSSPHIYADQIEYMCRQFKDNKNIIISVHTHNDRGCAVAAAELGQCAGATRVEGTLFGNGERTGNADLVTLALNCYTQGIDPELDFSNINQICEQYTACTGMTIPVRQPYSGELVFTAFSGSHQDAISKSLAWHSQNGGVWDIPYLPIDPADIGRDYQSVIRINSQSGKGGASYIMEQVYGIQIPSDVRADFGDAVKNATFFYDRELSAEEVYTVFKKTFTDSDGPYRMLNYTSNPCDSIKSTYISSEIQTPGSTLHFESEKHTFLDTIRRVLIKQGINVEYSVSEQTSTPGQPAPYTVFFTVIDNDGCHKSGASINHEIPVAALQALCAALNRLHVLVAT